MRWSGWKKRDLGRLKIMGPVRRPRKYPTLSPRMAEHIKRVMISGRLRSPAPQTTPTVNNSESPGRKNPISKPVSAKTIPHNAA